MTIQPPPISRGLEGTYFAETDISDIGGDTDTLEYRGYHIRDLALNAQYEEIVFLLWYGKLPTRSELVAFTSELYVQRTIPADIIEIMRRFPGSAAPMDALRTAVSALGLFETDATESGPEAHGRRALRLTGAMGTLVAAWERVRNGLEPLAPRDDLGTASNFLYMLSGQEPDEARVRAINSYLVMLADHGMNASTFSARVTTSTLSDIYSAVTSAIGTLKGAAHGGANEKAMRQFIEIGSPERVDEWFANAVSSGRRVMGIGHRVYKTGDPRMPILKQQAANLALSSGDSRWYDIAARLEEVAVNHPYFVERRLIPNVDYYSAITLYESGIPVDQFTPLFAVSRIAGWCAHVIEQWRENRMIRPEILYTGPHDRTWVPIEQRG